MSDLPIEVYADSRRGDAIAWFYSGKCGFPEGLVAVGKPVPKDCNVTITIGTAPPG